MEASLKGPEANRIHGNLVECFTYRSVHSADFYDGHRGTTLSRVRHHAQCRCRCFRARFADTHADDVSRLLRPEREEKHGRLFQLTEGFFEGMLHAYERGLIWVLSHQPFTLLVALATLVGTIWLSTSFRKVCCPNRIPE